MGHRITENSQDSGFARQLHDYPFPFRIISIELLTTIEIIMILGDLGFRENLARVLDILANSLHQLI